jgi:hypothetical protein
MVYHPILAQQLQQCFPIDMLASLASEPTYGHAFTVFLSHVSRTYFSVDKQHQVAKAIAKTAHRAEEARYLVRKKALDNCTMGGVDGSDFVFC